MEPRLPPRKELKEIEYRAIAELGGTATNSMILQKVLEMLNLPKEVTGKLKAGHTEKTQLENELDWCRTDLRKEERLVNIGDGVWAISNANAENIFTPAPKLLKPIMWIMADKRGHDVENIVSTLELQHMGSAEDRRVEPSVKHALSILVRAGYVKIKSKKYAATSSGLDSLFNGFEWVSLCENNPDLGWGPADYTPGISKDTWIALIDDPNIFNASSRNLVAKYADFGGMATCSEIAEAYGGTFSEYNATEMNLAKRIHEKTGCPLYESNGKVNYWTVLMTGRKSTVDTSGTFEWRLRDELREAVIELNLVPEPDADPDSPSNKSDFFEFLESKGLDFEIETVENFLLSIKAKPFVILSGGSGTGKTKLAQAYGEFISDPPAEKPVTFDVTLGKSAENKGFTLNADTFFDHLPAVYREPDGIYRFRIGDVESEGKLTLAPRLFFRGENKEQVAEAINTLKQNGNKGELKLWIKSTAAEDPEGKSYEIIPVGSNWTDSRPIVGYMNALTKCYHSTPALEIIRRASRSDNPYLMILDEMNLSHVERYFSDILSAIESGEPIKLDDPEERVLRIPDTLITVGTVNIDETTYMFSPKVLDRANVIEFEPASVERYLSGTGNAMSTDSDVEFLQNCGSGSEVRKMKAREIVEAMSSGGCQSAVSDIASDLNQIQILMSEANLPFGYRTVDEFMRFMYVAWIYERRGGFENWKRYFDAQVMQKILPKIHGSSTLGPSLVKLAELCAENGFQKSERKLRRMISVLDSQRYVSFYS